MYEAIVISRADFPVVIKYNGEDKVVSPRERFQIEKISLLGQPLPKELKIQKLN